MAVKKKSATGRAAAKKKAARAPRAPRKARIPQAVVEAPPAPTVEASATAVPAKKGKGGLFVALALLAVLAGLGGQAYYVARAKAAMKFDFDRNGAILGQGVADGLGTGPQSIAGDAKGDVFFLDGQEREVMRLQKFDANIKYVCKYQPTRADQVLGHAIDVDCDAKGNVYVLENNGVILTLDNDLRFLNTAKVQVNDPAAMAVSADGRIFVAARGDNKVQIFDGSGRSLGEFGAPGTKSGDLARPCKITFDGAGRLAVLEDTADVPRVKVFDKDLKLERSFRLVGVHLCPPLRIGADTLGLMYLNDFDGNKGILVYNLASGKQIGEVKGTSQGDVIVTPGSCGANHYAQRIYVHTIPGMIPCAFPAGHLN